MACAVSSEPVFVETEPAVQLVQNGFGDGNRSTAISVWERHSWVRRPSWLMMIANAPGDGDPL